jgi:hypothetical protein
MCFHKKTLSYVAYIATVFLLFISCTSVEDEASESDEYEDRVINQDLFETVTVSSFEITEITGKFEQVKGKEGAIFNVSLNVKNNTTEPIHSVELKSAIKAKFQSEEIVRYYPNPSYHYNSDLEYFDGPTASQYGGINNYRAKVKWQPGETKSFNLRVFNYYGGGWAEMGFGDSMFERTPERVEFIVACKFFGLDDEFEDLMEVTLLDLWKEYQIEIGLRE